MDNWEYKVYLRSVRAFDKLEQEFNGLGKQGWELVCVTTNGNYHTFYFKRRIG